MRKSGCALVVGVYLLDHESYAGTITHELSSARCWQVEQSWAALGSGSVSASLSNVTSLIARRPTPKFTLLNRLLAEQKFQKYEFVLVMDDDIRLPPQFLDEYLDVVSHCRFSLAQPALTPQSFIDHCFVRQFPGLDARQTNFVGTAPLFSISRAAFDSLIPFDEESPMGWGYDSIWPVVLAQRSLRLGIVDKVPIARDLRKPVSHCRLPDAERQMQDFLTQRRHLDIREAFSIVESYATVHEARIGEENVGQTDV
ncbi:hypothetical protein ACW73L_08195 [Methylolobus aquaticus]